MDKLLVMSDDLSKVEGIEINQDLTPRVDLPTARNMLQAVVSTHENSFTKDSQLDRVGSYSTDQVRTALQIFCLSLLSNHEVVDTELAVSTRKLGSYGELELILFREQDDNLHPMTDFQHVTLRLVDPSNKGQLENTTPLKNVKPNKRGSWDSNFGFADTRGTTVVSQFKRADLSDLKHVFKLEDFRLMWRGLRWMCANILNWDQPSIIIPEQLDTPSLPPKV